MLAALAIIGFAAVLAIGITAVMLIRMRARRRPVGPPMRTVQIDPGYAFEGYAHFQANYMMTEVRQLMPNTLVKLGDETVLRVNSLGLKGPEPVKDRPFVAVFGDSLVQGVGPTSLVDYMELPGFQALNCGIEGANLEMAAQRFVDLSSKVNIAAVILHAGWHNLIYGENDEDHWIAQFDRFSGPVVAHLRLVTDSNQETLERGYEGLYHADYVEVHPLLRRRAGRQRIKDVIDRFNDVQERYCRERGRPIIDLDPLLQPTSYEEVSTRFFDMCHPRYTMYPEIGREISRQIMPYLECLPVGVRFPARKTTAPAAQPAQGLVILPFGWSDEIRRQSRQRRSVAR